MKKYGIMIWVFMAVVPLLAQKADDPKKKMTKEERMERYEAQKVAHLTSELELNVEDAQRFWPVYNEYAAKKKALRKEMNWKKVEEMTEEEAEAFLAKSREVRAQVEELDRQMMKDLEGVLTAKQQLKLERAEKNFHRETAKRYSKKKRKMKRERKEAGGEE